MWKCILLKSDYLYEKYLKDLEEHSTKNARIFYLSNKIYRI